MTRTLADRDDVLGWIANGENSGMEFKRDTVDNHKLAKELVALANLDGGVVLLGVDDDGSVPGITRQNLEEWVMTTCRDKVKPEIIPFFRVVRDVEPGRHVAVVRVERGFTVHHVWHDDHRTYYVRVGSQSREASQEELARLMQQRQHFRADIAPISGSSLADLDLDRLTEYFAQVRGQEAPAFDDEAGWRVLLDNTELVRGNEEGAPCTLAGLVLFGQRPDHFLPQSGVDAFAFPGAEKDYATLDRQRIRGPLVAAGYGTGQVNRVREPGLIEQTIGFVQRHAGVTAYLADGARRVERTTYHPEVVREAVVNAVAHRDYLFANTTVEVSLYADRLEIISPGRLPNGITPDRMRTGCRAARNPMLRDVLQDYGYLEASGMGVPRKILRLTREHNGTEPELIAEDHQFTLRIWRGASATP